MNDPCCMRQQPSSYIHRKTVLQLMRFAIVGMMNTLLTLIVIYICKSVLEINPWVSNGIGYVAGFINSFIWNKLWVFNSHADVVREAIKFIVGFILCYWLQLLATWLLTEHTPLHGEEFHIIGFVFSGYGIATLLGMVVYTIANFIFNRAVTFKS
ncbi:MAG: GtrA family protein [Bacteroidales bacterium]|nr:GtrA family protein [Bacteroidales bacterium]